MANMIQSFMVLGAGIAFVTLFFSGIANDKLIEEINNSGKE